MDEDAESTTSDPARHPLPVEGSFVWYPKSEKPSRRRLIGSFVGEIGWFLLGLAAIEAVVALFAFPASSALTSHSGKYFGGLEDAVSLMFVGPLVMVAFGLIALVRQDWIFLLYPPAVFFVVGAVVQHTAAVSALSAAFPFKIHEPTSTNEYIATAMMSYALVYTLEHAISKVVSRGRFKSHPRFHPVMLASQAAILVFLVPLGIVAPTWGAQVQANEQQVRMPRTGDFSALNDSANQTDEFGLHFFGLYYLGRTQQYNGSYNVRDRVSYSVIERGATTDPRKVCGDRVRMGESGPTYTLQYQTTSNGVELGTYAIPHSTTQPPRKTVTNTEYHTCFVLDRVKYDLVRSSKYGTAYLEAYPTAKVVAAFVDAKSDAGKVDKTPIVKAPPDDGNGDINPKAYVQVASLAIKEWGIQIPLSLETKGLYYEPGDATKFSSYYRTLGEKSISDKVCHLGVRRDVKGEGIASISRTLYTGRDSRDRPTGADVPYKQIGKYLYHIEARSIMTSCLGGARASGYADSLVWATVNITPL